VCGVSVCVCGNTHWLGRGGDTGGEGLLNMETLSKQSHNSAPKECFPMVWIERTPV